MPEAKTRAPRIRRNQEKPSKPGGLRRAAERAKAGASAAKSYIGEQGPEMFIPRTTGTVIPAGETAAMMGGQRSAPRGGDTFIIQGATSKRATDRIRMDRDRGQRRATAEFA